MGLKPTAGLLSRHGLVALANALDTPALLTCSADDAAAVLRALLAGGADARDATCFVPRHYLQPEVPLVAFASDSPSASASPPAAARKRLRIAIPRVCCSSIVSILRSLSLLSFLLVSLACTSSEPRESIRLQRSIL